MSFFPRSFYSPDPSFTPLFRLLDEFDNYANEVRNSAANVNMQEGGGGRHHRRHHQAARTFNPRFDVRETDTAYELHGELPGVERENIDIEFTDPQTIVVRGRVERTYTAGTPPAGLLGEGAQMSGAITEKGEAAAENNNNDEAGGKKNESTTVAKKQQHGDEEQQHHEPRYKYWVQERSTGEFARTFSFPGQVDHDGVTASLKNGVLSLVVPKAKKHETKRIAIH